MPADERLVKYRLEVRIQRRGARATDYTTIGYASSGGWEHLDQAIHWLASGLDTREWEPTKRGPDPGTVDRDDDL